MLEVQTAGSNQIWIDKFPLLISLVGENYQQVESQNKTFLLMLKYSSICIVKSGVDKYYEN